MIISLVRNSGYTKAVFNPKNYLTLNSDLNAKVVYAGSLEEDDSVEFFNNNIKSTTWGKLSSRMTSFLSSISSSSWDTNNNSIFEKLKSIEVQAPYQIFKIDIFNLNRKYGSKSVSELLNNVKLLKYQSNASNYVTIQEVNGKLIPVGFSGINSYKETNVGYFVKQNQLYLFYCHKKFTHAFMIDEHLIMVWNYAIIEPGPANVLTFIRAPLVKEEQKRKVNDVNTPISKWIDSSISYSTPRFSSAITKVFVSILNEKEKMIYVLTDSKILFFFPSSQLEKTATGSKYLGLSYYSINASLLFKFMDVKHAPSINNIICINASQVLILYDRKVYFWDFDTNSIEHWSDRKKIEGKIFQISSNGHEVLIFAEKKVYVFNIKDGELVLNFSKETKLHDDVANFLDNKENYGCLNLYSSNFFIFSSEVLISFMI